MGISSVGQRLLGVALGICATFALVAGFVVAIVIAPVLFIAHAAILRGAGLHDRRARFHRVRPDRPREVGPVIEGEFEVIGEAMPEQRSQRERTVFAGPIMHRWPPAHTV